MKRLTRLLSLLFAVALVAAACSSDGDSGSGDGDTETEAGGGGGGVDNDAAAEALGGGSDDEEEEGDGEEGEAEEAAPAATSMEELEAQWAERRAEIVETLSSDEYGVGDDNVLRGPGGFEVDLNNCPSNWSDTEGISGDTISIGLTTAQSGNLAAYGDIAVGMQVYFDYVNENGGINGANVEMIIKDDAYVATNTIELVGEMLQADKPFAISTLGSPNTLAVYETLNDNCVPQPFVQTGHPAWGDPVEHPWTTGLQMSYATEAILWGNWIKQNMADQLPVTVAGLVNDNDFGKAYGRGFEAWVEENPDVVSEFIEIGHEPTAATVTNEMTTIAAQNPDVFISMTAGNTCLLAIQEAANNGLAESAVLFTPSVCKDPQAFMIPAGGAGDGWNIVGGGIKIFTDPQYADEPFVDFALQALSDAGLDNTVGNYSTGIGMFGWAHIEALRVAAELDGGLTRTNYLLAIHSLDLEHPSTLDGITFAVNGAEDSYFIEGSDISVYDAEGQTWTQVGDVVDLNGSSPNCTWTDDGCT